MRKPILATRVSPYVNQSVRKLAKGLGISISEYLRNLILQDLDSRKMFQDELKKAVEQSEADDHTQKSISHASAHRTARKFFEALAREESEDEQRC